MAEQNLWSWSLDIVHLLPRSPAFLNKATFFSTEACPSSYWLLSGQRQNLHLGTPLSLPSPTPLPHDSFLAKIF